MRQVAVLSFAAAFLALLCVVAGQKYSHYFVGNFRGADQTNLNQLAHWKDGRWQSVPSGFIGDIVDIAYHPSDNAILYAATTSGFVYRYDLTAQTYVPLGEKFAANSIKDIFVWGNTLYIAGSNNFGIASRDPQPSLIAQRALDADARSAWRAFPDDTDITHQLSNFAPPVTSVDQFVFLGSGTPVARSGNTLYFQGTDGVWSTDTTLAAMGSNLRGPLGAGPLSATRVGVSGGFIFLWSDSASLGISTDTTNAYFALRSQDGRTWEAVFTLGTTTGWTINIGTYSADVDGTYFLGTDSNTLPAVPRSAMFFQPRGTSFTPSQVGDYVSSVAGTSTANTYIFRFNGRLFILSPSFTTYVDGGDQTDPNFAQYRSYRTLDSGIASVDPAAGTSATWQPALGGGLTGTTLGGAVTWGSTARWAISADGTNLFITHPNIRYGWNVAAYGVAALDGSTGTWAPFGMPRLSDFSSTGIPSSGTPTIRVVNHYNNDDGTTQTVIIGGSFRRLNNGTMNSLAWADSSAPTTWNPLGNAGVAGRGGDVVPTSSGLFYELPGDVYSMVYMPDPERRANARLLFVGGTFAQSGDIALNNIGRYYLKGSNTWSNMAGGVSLTTGTGQVLAMDYSGRKLFVGGEFDRAGNVSALNVAMWDDEKETWSNLGSGVNSRVNHIFANGPNDVLVAGDFSSAGGLDVPGLARWDGSVWKRVECDRCNTDCDRDKTFACFQGGSAHEIKNINGKVFLRHGSAVYLYEGGRFRQYNSFAALSGGDLVMTRAPDNSEAGYNLLIASSSRGNSQNLRNRWLIFNPDNENHAKTSRGGFSADVVYVSSGSMASPLMTLALVAAMVAALLM